MGEIKIKVSVAKAMGPSEIQSPLLGTLGQGPMYRLNPSLIGPGSKNISL